MGWRSSRNGISQSEGLRQGLLSAIHEEHHSLMRTEWIVPVLLALWPLCAGSSVPAPSEPASLSVARENQGDTLLRGSPLSLTGSKVQASQDLTCQEADATTLQLNWPPLPTATEYQVFRNGAYVGSTAGRVGYFLDRGLRPSQTYRYSARALDPTGRVVGQSAARDFSTRSNSTIRTRYTVLAVAFYPAGPGDAEELSHIKTYLKHRLDFIR